ncbi:MULTISPECIES: LuxR C-terminal-related transcriptional regulator [unclassified Saccharothrix]|uniref:LuxR C-terminal-related transcriptional regulator n=1 Tax=unclassified Saccharothrix TaxID=2593673 RepID=UPI00307D3B34
MTRTDVLEQGRESFARQAWGAAVARFAAADDDVPLDLDDLERFALAAYLTGDEDLSTRVWTRAHHEALRRDDPRRAARAAVLVGAGLVFRGETAPGSGWFGRAERVLEGCGECPERAWLRTWDAFPRMWGGDPVAAEAAFTGGVEVGRRSGDLDLVAMARLGQGLCLVLRGDVPAGVALLDEVMVGVTAGEVTPLYAGIVYCTVIAVCADLFDLRRAREWTAALTRWCEAQPDLVPYRGNCLVHRCELMRLQGAWGDALEAAERACALLSQPVRWDTLGAAHYQLGELRRLRGEFAAAEESYRRAGEAGRPPEPGLALLRLAQGRTDVAAAVMRRVVADTEDPAARSRVLPAHVEVMIAADDVPAARAGADELATLATAFDSPYLAAEAASAAGAVRLAEGDAQAASRELRRAATAWRALDAPHETARVRVLTALACRALGDHETATMELDSARAAFLRLGATPDVERVDALTTTRGGLTAREVEVLRLVASGRTNRAIAKELGLSEKTVARHVSNCLTKIQAPSRAAATAYAYEHSLI